MILKKIYLLHFRILTKKVKKHIISTEYNFPNLAISFSYSDLPPPPEPPPCQSLRQQMPIQRPPERKASSLERHTSNINDTKTSLERHARTSLERQRQTQEWLGSTERQNKQTFGSGKITLVALGTNIIT